MCRRLGAWLKQFNDDGTRPRFRGDVCHDVLSPHHDDLLNLLPEDVLTGIEHGKVK